MVRVLPLVLALALFISCDAQLQEDRAGDVPCLDGGYCPDGQTCCYTFGGSYGCCPYSDAVCCYDGDHCCPSSFDYCYDTCENYGGGADLKKKEKNPMGALRLLKAIRRGFREGNTEREEGSHAPRRGRARVA